MTGHIDPTKETFAAFRANDRAGPIHMLNLVRLRERAAYADGRTATGAEAQKHRPALAPVGRIGLGPGRRAAIRIVGALAQPHEIEHVDRARALVGAEGGEGLFCRIDMAGHDPGVLMLWSSLSRRRIGARNAPVHCPFERIVAPPRQLL